MTKTKVILFRFLKGAIAGAVGTMLAVSLPNTESWDKVEMWLTSLALAGFVGFVSGLLLAIDKWTRWEEEK